MSFRYHIYSAVGAECMYSLSFYPVKTVCPTTETTDREIRGKRAGERLGAGFEHTDRALYRAQGIRATARSNSGRLTRNRCLHVCTLPLVRESSSNYHTPHAGSTQGPTVCIKCTFAFHAQHPLVWRRFPPTHPASAGLMQRICKEVCLH